ncbi:MAG: serine/threonine protein kinase [Clostridia bacterium]|nr:serine/threonine protein kinase [Clostridia bacterium]
MTREEYIKEIRRTYSVSKCLSDKNNSTVLLLKHKELNKKIVLRSFAEKINAYEQLLSINCKNLPLIYDSITLDDGHIVLEEYIEGLTVEEIMQSGRYSYKGTTRVLSDVCNALYLLHSFDIVHRDIKPQNIMVDKNGRVVLIDLNASRKISTASKDTVVMGTVGYASPEQLGVTQSDKRTDIYALGVLLNVMLTGEHPSVKIAKGKAEKIIRKCTTINPNDRYQSVRELIDAL